MVVTKSIMKGLLLEKNTTPFPLAGCIY